MPLTLTMTRDLCCTSDLLGYMAWFLYQDTLAPAGPPAACQASYPATASLTRAGMLVGPVTADPAMQTNASPSRLPHLAKRMEDRGGFIRREPGPAVGRFTRSSTGEGD